MNCWNENGKHGLPAWCLVFGCGCFWLGMGMAGWPLPLRVFLVSAGGGGAAAVLPPVFRKIQRRHAGRLEWCGLAVAAGTLWFHPLLWIPVVVAWLCDGLQQCFGGGYERWAAVLMGTLPVIGCAWYAWSYEWYWTSVTLLWGGWLTVVLTEQMERWPRKALWCFSFWFVFLTTAAAVTRLWSRWYGGGMPLTPAPVVALVAVWGGIALLSWWFGMRTATVSGIGMGPVARGGLTAYGLLVALILVTAGIPRLRGIGGFEWRKQQYEITAETFQPFCAALTRYRREYGAWPETPDDLRRIGVSPEPWQPRLLDFFVDGNDCCFLVRVRLYLGPLSGRMTAEADDQVRWRICSPSPSVKNWTSDADWGVSEPGTRAESGKDPKDILTRSGDVL